MKFDRNMVSEEVSLDITPLIDVVFLMLIFFMVTTTFQQETSVRVELPRADRAATPETGKKIDVVVASSGKFLVNGRELVDSSESTLFEALRQTADGDYSLPVYIRADRNSTVQAMITAINAAKNAGLSKVAFATSESGQQ